MFTYRKLASVFASLIVIFSLTFSGFQPLPVSAQSGDDGRRQVNPQQGRDGLKRQVNPKTGRISFIGPESGRMLPAAKALGTFIRPQDPALALVNRYAPEFGIKDPGRELSEMKTNRPEDGRASVRYQQNYQGIPVMGGELIVNTNRNGDLYSMNGEVSPNLALQVQPKIDSAQAAQSALQEMAKWYQKTPADFVASAPQLWIYDESLLQMSTRPVELVWRMEVTAVDNSMPVRELVLVNAERGSISLHFNQIDTAWAGAEHSKNIQTLNAPISSPKNPENNDSAGTTHFTTENIPLLAPATWYVATTGLDANSCTAIGSPCLTINGVLAKVGFVAGDTIKVATGTYTGTGTEVALINKSVTLSGGWDTSFTTQSGMSIIDGQGVRRGITVNSSIITATIEHFVIQNGGFSDLGFGGGIYNDGTMTVNNSMIHGNSGGKSGYSGGGGGGGILNGGTMTLNNSTVSGNTILGYFYGSGILNSNYGVMTINNSTVSGNTASEGIYNEIFGTITLNNSTVSNNTVAGIYNGGTVTLHNSIVAKNGVSMSSNLSGNAANTSDHNLIGGDPKISSYLIGTPAYHFLLADSPAIDAGNPATCLSTDERGVSRPQGSACDIGDSTARSRSLITENRAESQPGA